MNIFSIIAVGIVIALISLVLKQHKPEYALLVSLAGGIFIMLNLLPQIQEIVAYIASLLDKTPIPQEYGEVIFKTLGICFATEIACGTCSDAGESAAAGKIEIAGKIAVLILTLPLFGQVLEVVYSIIN